MKTPAEILEKVLPRWRAKLPPRYSPDYIDGFIERNREFLTSVIARAMMVRRIKRGAPPETPDEFAAYARLVARERPKDLEPDDEVLRRLVARLEKMKPRGRVDPQAALTAYVEARAEAALLRQAGWDAVPLLLREPAIAIVVGDVVVAVVDVLATLHVAAGFDRVAQLAADVDAAHARVEALSREIGEPRLERFARALWARARGAEPSSKRAAGGERPAPSTETPPDLQTKSWRTEANLQAMRLVLAKEPGEITADDLQVLAQYSGWGGLSIESVKALIPAELMPESFGLIHEL
jgi:hypothetical protein